MEEKYIREIMQETCWNSISYCCSLNQECESRDNVIKKLGLTKKDFKKLKENFDKELFKLKSNPLRNSTRK